MKLSEIKGKPVVSIADARRVGSVDDVLVDPAFRHLTALRIRADGHGPEYVVATENVRGIGADAVTVVSHDTLLIPDRAPHLGGFPSLRSAINSRLLSERGEVIGRIREVHFDPVTKQVSDFEYTTGLIDQILDRPRLVSSSEVISVGPGVVTVQTTPAADGAPEHGRAPDIGRNADRPAGGRVDETREAGGGLAPPDDETR